MRFTRRHHFLVNLVVGLSLLSTPVFSQSTDDPSEAAKLSDTPSLDIADIQTQEAWEDADDYALENPVVAIALYGPKGDPRVEQAQQILEGWFASKGIPTKLFFGDSPNGNIGASYFVKGLAYGPTPIVAEKAIPKMQEAASVFPGAWPQHQQKNRDE